MLKRILFGLVALLATAMTIDEAKAAIVVSGEVVDVAPGFSGPVDVGLFVTSDVNTVLTGFNVPILNIDPPAAFVEFDAVSFGFGVDSATPLANPPFIASFGLGGATGNVALTAGQATQIGSVTFNITGAPVGTTSIGQLQDTGFDANFFSFSTTDGTLSALNGLATIGPPDLSISAVPEPSSLAALGVLGVAAGAVRRRRKAKAKA